MNALRQYYYKIGKNTDPCEIYTINPFIISDQLYVPPTNQSKTHIPLFLLYICVLEHHQYYLDWV